MENDGFKLVKKKNHSRKKKCHKTAINYDLGYEEVDVQSSVKKIQEIKEKLSSDNRVHEFLAQVNLKKNSIVDHPGNRHRSIVCYGLGNVSSCYNARCQMSILLLLKEHTLSSVFAFDPIFSATDKKLLNIFDIHLLTQNEEGKRSINSEGTLFYMPHCPSFLYNNLLWANWHKNGLRNLVIIGNSFKSLIEDHISSKFSVKYKYISMTKKLIDEYKFPSIQYDAFNEISLITFCGEDLNDIVWETVDEEPVYSDGEYL